MSASALQFLGTLATAVLAFFGIWLSVRQSGQKTKTDAAQGLFNELQEERAELKQDRAELTERVNRIEKRERIRDDYIQELRNHIRRGLPPPPPPWPEELRRG